MTRLRKVLAALTKSLGIQEDLRDFHVRRMLARHKEQVAHEDVIERLEDEADALWKRARTLRKQGHAARADEARRKAQRKDAAIQKRRVRRGRAEAKAVVGKQRARNKTKLIQGIKTDIADVQREIAKLGPTVNLEESKVRGGDFAERWRLSNLTSVECCSNGRRRNAYSQAGAPDIWHPYGPGPAAGRRDDCSTYVTSQALATGADDPNGEDFRGPGYTGTLAQAHGRWVEVSLSQMIEAGHGYIVYGSGTGFHTEAYCPSGPGSLRTAGHGSAPVDFATVHAFGNVTERYFIYVTD